jgi:hypothetical protein
VSTSTTSERCHGVADVHVGANLLAPRLVLKLLDHEFHKLPNFTSRQQATTPLLRSRCFAARQWLSASCGMAGGMAGSLMGVARPTGAAKPNGLTGAAGPISAARPGCTAMPGGSALCRVQHCHHITPDGGAVGGAAGGTGGAESKARKLLSPDVLLMCLSISSVLCPQSTRQGCARQKNMDVAALDAHEGPGIVRRRVSRTHARHNCLASKPHS